MSIGAAALWATIEILDTAVVVWPAALFVTVILVCLRMFSRHRPSWFGILGAALVTAVAFALAFGHAPILPPTPGWFD